MNEINKTPATDEELTTLLFACGHVSMRWPNKNEWYEAVRHVVRNCDYLDFPLEKDDGNHVAAMNPNLIARIVFELIELRKSKEKDR